MLNPCCCLSPRIGSFIFAIFDIVIGVSTVFWAIKLVSISGKRYQTWIEFGFALLLLLLAILLLIGTVKNSAEKLRLWLIIWLIVILCFAAFQIVNITSIPVSGERVRLMSSLGGTLLFLYQVWIVWAFIHELRYGPAGLTYCPAQVV